MPESNQTSVRFLQWALPKLGYRWNGFRKPRGQVLKRIQQRIADLNISGIAAYKTYLNSHPEEWKELDKLLYVTISRFYRDRKLWEDLSKNIIPNLVKKRSPNPVKIWSAGCCNGEEPYSIAIAADMNGNLHDVSILASDRNPEVLKRAKAGIYAESSVKELSDYQRNNYFEWDSEKSGYQIHQKIKDTVIFEQRDISESLPDERFDLIFCRYLVFTYFSEPRQNKFLEWVFAHLSDDGYLIAGSNENITKTK